MLDPQMPISACFSANLGRRRGGGAGVEASSHVRAAEARGQETPESEGKIEGQGRGEDPQAAAPAGPRAAPSRPDRPLPDRRRRLSRLRPLLRLGGRQGRLRARNRAHLPGRRRRRPDLHRPDARDRRRARHRDLDRVDPPRLRPRDPPGLSSAAAGMAETVVRTREDRGRDGELETQAARPT